jgi:hypothetical protein
VIVRCYYYYYYYCGDCHHHVVVSLHFPLLRSSGVIPHFDDHVVQLASGPSVALEIRAEDAVNTFRVTCGPWDISMAKELRPGKQSHCG